MNMPPGLRKFALTAHLTSSVGWIGAVVAYLALGITVTSPDGQTVRAAWIAMELTGWFAIVPLALAALLTGIVMSLGTPWGLFRHYWVLITLVLTILSTVVLLLHMPTVSSLANVAREADGAVLGGHGGDLFHAGGPRPQPLSRPRWLLPSEPTCSAARQLSPSGSRTEASAGQPCAG